MPPLLHLITTSQVQQLIIASVACVRNLSIHASNETPIVEAGFLTSLISLLANSNEEIACHAISTIRNLAASESNKKEIGNTGLIDKIFDILSLAVKDIPSVAGSSSPNHASAEAICSFAVQGELTALLAVLALSGKI